MKTIILLLIVVLIAMAVPSAAGTLQTLYTFTTADGGGDTASGLIFDTAGNLYGTTTGQYGCSAMSSPTCGEVFELSPGTNGQWSKKVLHSFALDGVDGAIPLGNLTMDGAGNLYGTTSIGGAHYSGSVFELSPGTNGQWTEKILYSFQNNGADAYFPEAGLTLDKNGNLFGTTVRGGTGQCLISENSIYLGCGTVFNLTRGIDGQWTEQILHSFQPNGGDGMNPQSNVIFDAAGNLYSTTAQGGDYKCGPSVILHALGGCGTVFELMPGAGGQWTEKILRNFHPSDAQYPSSGVIFDPAGNLYGETCCTVGFPEVGTVFELMPATTGEWTFKVLRYLGSSDGFALYGGLVFDAAGSLYGVDVPFWNDGIVFKLTPTTGGLWNVSTLYVFPASQVQGAGPNGPLVFDSVGNLYSTTFGGGTINGKLIGDGTVFKLTP